MHPRRRRWQQHQADSCSLTRIAIDSDKKIINEKKNTELRTAILNLVEWKYLINIHVDRENGTRVACNLYGTNRAGNVH